MAGVDPFWLYDKVDPDDDNDPEEVIKAANNADELTGRRKPERAINRLDEREAFDSIRDYQKKRNMKVDGVLNPNGPTAQRMSAGKHALVDRKNPPAFSTLLGRGSRVPLWGR